MVKVFKELLIVNVQSNKSFLLCFAHPHLKKMIVYGISWSVKSK